MIDGGKSADGAVAEVLGLSPTEDELRDLCCDTVAANPKPVADEGPGNINQASVRETCLPRN